MLNLILKKSPKNCYKSTKTDFVRHLLITKPKIWFRSRISLIFYYAITIEINKNNANHELINFRKIFTQFYNFEFFVYDLF